MLDIHARYTTKPAIPNPACAASMISPFCLRVDWARSGAMNPEKIASANNPAAALMSDFRRHYPARSTMNQERELFHPANAHENVGAKQDAPRTHAPQIENTKVNAEQNSSCHKEQGRERHHSCACQCALARAGRRGGRR